MIAQNIMNSTLFRSVLLNMESIRGLRACLRSCSEESGVYGPERSENVLPLCWASIRLVEVMNNSVSPIPHIILTHDGSNSNAIDRERFMLLIIRS